MATQLRTGRDDGLRGPSGLAYDSDAIGASSPARRPDSRSREPRRDLLPVGITQSCRCEESVNDHVRGMFAKQVDLLKLPFSAP